MSSRGQHAGGEFRPRVRAVEAFRADHEGKPVVCLRDPAGYTDAIVMLPPAALAIVSLFDGTRTIADVQAEIMRRAGALVGRDRLETIARSLDEALFLDSDRFRAEVARVEAEFLASPARPARHADRSYPADPAALRALLDSFFRADGGPGAPGPRRGPGPRALVAPHIDFARGGAAYAHAYRPLCECGEPPDLVVVFGTDHVGVQAPFTLTRKDYETPLGAVPTDRAVVSALVSALGEEPLFLDEVHHRSEHSIEFQAVWLRHALGDASFRLLPVLCGPRCAGDDVDRFLAALRDATAGSRVLVVAGADLAHVGPRFGDPAPLGPAERVSLERADRATLAHAARGDAGAFLASVGGGADPRRICGASPIHAMLRTAPGEGRIAAYAQCPADSDGGSLVSIASVAYGGGGAADDARDGAC